jgi:hypothetical protein
MPKTPKRAKATRKPTSKTAAARKLARTVAKTRRTLQDIAAERAYNAAMLEGQVYKNPALKRLKTAQDFPYAVHGKRTTYHHPATGAEIADFEGHFFDFPSRTLMHRGKERGEAAYRVAGHQMDALGRWRKLRKNSAKRMFYVDAGTRGGKHEGTPESAVKHAASFAYISAKDQARMLADLRQHGRASGRYGFTEVDVWEMKK